MLQRPRLLASIIIIMAGGCASPAPRSVCTFRSPPRGWSRFRSGLGEAASLKVDNAHLDLPAGSAFVDGAGFGDVQAIADVALLGGDTRGFAGIFVADLEKPGSPCACLAVRPGGEYRVYRSSDPLEPSGGRGWRPLSRASPAGFLRLGLDASGGGQRFLVDGAEVDRLGADMPMALSNRQPASGSHSLHVGLFSKTVASRWKNFIAGGSGADGRFQPEVYADWGDAHTAEQAMREAQAGAKALHTKPSRIQIYTVAASLDEAHRALAASGDSPRAESVLAAAARFEDESRDSARSIGEGELHERAFARFHALATSKTARPKETDEISGETQSRLAAMKGKLRPLRLDYAVECSVKKPVFEASAFSEPVREVYGALERSRSGELKIRVKLERSSNDAEAADSKRRVPVSPSGTGKLAELEAERTALEKKFADDLLDAQARAEVVRAAASVLGPRSLAALKPFDVGGKSLELHLDDGKTLEKLEARLVDLRARIRKESGSERVEYRSIPARLHTNSILVEVSYEVALDGLPLVRVSKERTYLGIEQWSHTRNEGTGTPASRFQEERVAAAAKTVEARALARFRTAISKENLLAKLEPPARLEFLARLARSSGDEVDRANLEWFLRSDLGLEGSALTRALGGLLE